MQIAILHCQQTHNFDFETSLFKYLFFCICSEGLIHIDPPSRERPRAVSLLDQQNFSVFEYSRPGIQFGSLEADLATKQMPHLLIRKTGVTTCNLGRNISYSLESLQVKRVFRVGQSSLRNKL